MNLWIWLKLAVAQDCALKSQADWIAELQAQASRASYECLAADESAAAALIAALGAEPPPDKPERLSRALALWRLHRLDQPVPDEEARAYLAVDRRLLGDGVRAFRGRPTPSPEHELVFKQLAWYKPTPSYVDGRLTETDRQNIQKFDSPPPVPKPEAPGAAEAMAEAAPAEEAAPPAGGCKLGCASARTPTGLVAGLGALGLAALLARRDQTGRR